MEFYEGMRFYESTSYPKLFRQVYWGQFRYRDRACVEELRMIVENRDRFYEDYHIKSVLDKRPQWVLNETFVSKTGLVSKYTIMDDIRDHVEYYRDLLGNIVSVFSMDDGNIDKTPIIEKGYHVYLPLYQAHQTTYIKVLPRKKNGEIQTV